MTIQEFDTQGDKVCGDCGESNCVWFAESSVWNAVMGGPEATDDPGGVTCPRCFIRRAEAVGVRPIWRLVAA